jgi:hypothetical protein
MQAGGSVPATDIRVSYTVLFSKVEMGLMSE